MKQSANIWIHTTKVLEAAQVEIPRVLLGIT